MKNKFALCVLVMGAAFFALGWAAAQQHAKLHPKTMENLSTAMHGEAFAYAKYEMFADQARKDGNTALADLFDKTAKVEQLEHFREHAELAGIVGTDQANLKDAIKGESYETDTMYPTFAKEARAAGDQAAANRFAEIGKDEAGHRDAFRAELNKLQAKRAPGN
jgi:rubrerythrin